MKLKGSIYCLRPLFSVFSTDGLDREVDGPVWVVLGRSWGLCMRAWAALGAFVGGLGPLL